MPHDEPLDTEATPISHLRASRVLIVEDDPAFSDFLAWSLAEHGYAVDTAGTTREALQLLSRALPAAAFDLVLSDIAMPGSPGTDLLFSSVIIARQTPVILMSGYATRELRAFVEDCGGDFLHKPFKLDQLFQCVLGRLRARYQAGSGAPVLQGEAP
jgi:DNA-binding response OmpR family regulator